MKTPFTLYFGQAKPPTRLVNHRPFIPQFPLSFVQADCALHVASANDVHISYRWHDAYDVFVAILEGVGNGTVSFPIESHLRDLYLVYQLRGTSHFLPDAAQFPKAPPVNLEAGHRMEVYTPPARAMLQIQPDPELARYALVAVVPKSGWVTRHPTRDESPMENLIHILKQETDMHHYLHPSPINSDMYAWLHMLLSTPAYEGMRLDDALNGPMVRLMEEHRREHRYRARENEDAAFIESARLLVRQLLRRMEDGVPPTAATIAHAMHTTPKRIRAAHFRYFNQRFDHFIFACRIMESKERLLTDLPISAIAYQLGWTDPTNFSHDFKRHTGMTPTEFRRMHNLGEG